MTNVFQERLGHALHECLEPFHLDRGISVDPIFDLQLGESRGEEHQGDGDDVRFPLQMECRLQRVVDERPRHLDHLLLLLVVHVFYVFRELQQVRISMVDL